MEITADRTIFNMDLEMLKQQPIGRYVAALLNTIWEIPYIFSGWFPGEKRKKVLGFIMAFHSRRHWPALMCHDGIR